MYANLNQRKIMKTEPSSLIFRNLL